MLKIQHFSGRRATGRHATGRHASMGSSMVELALILPVLLILVFGVVDFGRALLFNNIMVNMGREGANLAARTTSSSPFIIKALTDTAAPLDMSNQGGMVYIARVQGVTVGGTVRANVIELYRAPAANTTLVSKVWTCGVNSWDTNGATIGKCNLPAGQNLIPIANWTLPLADGDEVRVAEVLYHYTPLTGYVMKNAVDLYSATVL
jgi:Flp pilus assembly protein TadG